MDPNLNMLPSDTPQLLQAIFSYKPTVFDSTQLNMPQRYNGLFKNNYFFSLNFKNKSKISVHTQPSSIIHPQNNPYHSSSQETQKLQNQFDPSLFKLTGNSPTNLNLTVNVIQKTQQTFIDGSSNNQQQVIKPFFFFFVIIFN